MSPKKKTANAGSSTLTDLQLAILTLSVLSDPVSITVIFPFVPYLVQDFMDFAPEEQYKIGYYAGIISSSYTIAQVISTTVWTRLSDRVGRRPIFFVGMAGNIICMLAFGLAPTFATAIAARFMQGLLNSNITVAKCYLADVTDRNNENRGFMVIGIAFGAGSILGPIVGGYLSQPADKYPSLFSPTGLFADKPFLLPCLAVSIYVFIDFVFAYFWLPEPKRRVEGEEVTTSFSDEQDDGGDEETGNIDGGVDGSKGGGGEKEQKLIASASSSSSPGTYGAVEGSEKGVSIKAPSNDMAKDGERLPLLSELDDEAGGVGGAAAARPPKGSLDHLFSFQPFCVVLLLSFSYGLTFISNVEVFPVWARGDSANGGVSFTTSDIGTIQGIGGLSGMTAASLVFTRVADALGVVRTLRCGLLLLLLGYSAPFFVSLSGWGREDWAPWIALASGNMLSSVGAELCFPSLDIITKNSVPAEFIGTGIGLRSTAMKVGFAIGPVGGASLFAWASKPHDFLPFFLSQGRLFYVLSLSALVVVLSITARLPSWPWSRPR